MKISRAISIARIFTEPGSGPDQLTGTENLVKIVLIFLFFGHCLQFYIWLQREASIDKYNW